MRNRRHYPDGRTITGNHVEGRIKTRAFRDAWLDRLEELVAEMNEQDQGTFTRAMVRIEYVTVWHRRPGRKGLSYPAGKVYKANLMREPMPKAESEGNPRKTRLHWEFPTRVAVGYGWTIEKALRDLEVDIRTSNRLDRYYSFQHDS